MAETAVTNFLDVYEYAFTEIEDVRLDSLMSENPALFLRRCWDYLKNGIPLFTAPKGIQDKLNDLVAPQFASETFSNTTDQPYQGEAGYAYLTVSVTEIVAETAVTTTRAILNASEENPEVSENGVTYNYNTGEITVSDLPPQSEGIVTVEADYYTDGYFNSELTPEEIAILGKCFSIVWFNKIANTFLRTTPKIKDKNFNTDSSFGVEQADTAKLRAMRIELQDMMSDYEQTMAYKVTVPSGRQLLNRI